MSISRAFKIAVRYRASQSTLTVNRRIMTCPIVGCGSMRDGSATQIVGSFGGTPPEDQVSYIGIERSSLSRRAKEMDWRGFKNACFTSTPLANSDNHLETTREGGSVWVDVLYLLGSRPRTSNQGYVMS